MLFFTEICWERHQINTSTTKNKQAKAFSIFLLIKLSYAENAANLQSRAGQDFFGGVQPSVSVSVNG